jgi:hypothetical protein
MAQIYPRALGSLYFVSYDSQGYGGGILTLLHMGETVAAHRYIVSARTAQ